MFSCGRLGSLARGRKAFVSLTLLAIVFCFFQAIKSGIVLKTAPGFSSEYPRIAQVGNRELCDIHDEIDIVDDRVLRLNVPASPNFPLQNAWFKCEAGTFS